MSLKDNLPDNLEPFDDHIDCSIGFHTDTREVFRVHVYEGNVTIGKNIHYAIVESAFFCNNHGIYIESPDDYEWDMQ